MRTRAFLGLLLAVTVIFGGLGGVASSAQAAPQWGVTMTHSTDPFEGDTFIRGEEPGYSLFFGNANHWDINIINTGDETATGPLTFTDVLPPGIKVVSIGYGTFGTGGENTPACPSLTEINEGVPLTCSMNLQSPANYPDPGPIPPGQPFAPIYIAVEVLPGSPDTLTNEFTLSGGGAPTVTLKDSVGVIDTEPFHVGRFEARTTEVSEAPTPATENIPGLECCEGPKINYQPLDNVAGGHPPGTTMNRFTFARYPTNEQFKDAVVRVPPGFFGNPAAAPRCPISILQGRPSFEYPVVQDLPGCPPGSKIGMVGLSILDFYGGVQIRSLYNVKPDRGYSAQFAANVYGNVFSLYVVPLPRSEGYGLTIGSTNSARAGVKMFSAFFYGVPSEHGAGTSGAPFLTNPVNCSEAEPKWEIYADSWENPGRSNPETNFPDLTDPIWSISKAITPPVIGCDDPALTSQFHPSVDVQPVQEGPAQPDNPAGVKVQLDFPQTNDPTDLHTVFDASKPQAPEPKDVTVKLPEGVSLSAGASDGLQGCSDLASDPAGDQVHYDTVKPVTCPDASIIGSATANTPLLASHDPVDDSVTGPDPLPGVIYLIKPHPGDLTSGQDGTFRILLQLNSDKYGVNFKLPGTVHADKSTGQLTTTFLGNPQLPASKLELNFKTGPRAPLAMPSTCGTFTTSTELIPWSTPGTPDATPSSSFTISQGVDGSPCANTPAARPFNPILDAGTQSTGAGKASPFILRISRKAGEQEFSSLDLSAPKGFTASLKGVSYCGEAAIAAAAGKSGADELANPSCPAAAKIGTLTAAAGTGSNPFYNTGQAYLAGPYKGAPLSAVLITPVVAGPFDLGTIVVRAAIDINPETTQVTIHSDPIPQIFDGVPLRIQSIVVRLDRPGFSLNPTNCQPKALSATIGGASGAVATPSNAFQVDGCKALGFAPKLALRLKGSTKRLGHPALSATVTYPKGAYANIASAAVALPKAEFLDNSHIGTVCTRVQFAAHNCPAASIYGFAKATTPLLDGPVQGPVYLRSSSNKLPDLVADLNGQIEVALAGRIDTNKAGGIRNTFEAVPDVPVTQFTLELEGGKKGLLENSENLCKEPQHATANFTGQNGRTSRSKPLVANGCKKSNRAKKHKRAKRHGRG
jgi:uncharacterized repeat protein (TIGR01451 family)